MMQTLEAQHKCRLCGKTFGGAVGSYKIAEREMLWLISGQSSEDVLAPRIVQIHYCDDGGIGLADFIGWKAVKE